VFLVSTLSFVLRACAFAVWGEWKLWTETVEYTYHILWNFGFIWWTKTPGTSIFEKTWRKRIKAQKKNRTHTFFHFSPWRLIFKRTKGDQARLYVERVDFRFRFCFFGHKNLTAHIDNLSTLPFILYYAMKPSESKFSLDRLERLRDRERGASRGVWHPLILMYWLLYIFIFRFIRRSNQHKSPHHPKRDMIN
jgi:hypothetical protein